MINQSTHPASLLIVRQSLQFKMFGSKRLKHLDRTIDVASEIWNHAVALKNRYYKMFGKGLPKSKLQAHLAKLRSVATLHSPRGRLAGCSSWPLRFLVFSSGGNLNRK